MRPKVQPMGEKHLITVVNERTLRLKIKSQLVGDFEIIFLASERFWH
jgi:hypothetical protein